jgi:UDP-glucose 4-epimerase
MKQVLITGGAGFIGSHTVDLCLQAGMRVVVLDNLTSGKLSYLNLSHPNLQFIEDDINHYQNLCAIMENCDAVLHLAALPSVPKSIEDPIHSLTVNTLGFVRVLQSIREVKPSIRVVYASSAAVYGHNTTLPCQDTVAPPVKVLSPYALEKANNERYAALYTQLFGIKSLGLRYFNVYGSRQDPSSPYSGVISKFMENYQRQSSLILFGNGEQSRDFIHVSDVARANLLAIQSDYCGVLNIATGVPETLNNLIRYIELAGGDPAKINHLAPRVGDIEQSYAGVIEAERQLNFRYTTNLIDGIRDLMKMFSVA